MARRIFFIGLLLLLTGQVESARAELALPTPEQIAWHNMEIGMFIHFGLETYQDTETDDFSTPLDQFNPTQLDTDQWVAVAESMGARYIVLVAKHVGGFCLWQTDSTEYSIKHTPWRGGKGDIVAELAESCRRRGMALGVYVYPGSLYHGSPVGSGGLTTDPVKQEEYSRIYRQQLTEVLSRYGTMMEMWFDGSVQIGVGDLLEKYAPHAMVFQGKHCTIRWVGNERGFAPDPTWNAVMRADALTGTTTARHGTPDGDYWLPNEVDTVIRDHYWFWNTTNEKDIKSLDLLMETYYNSVGRSSVLLLNVGPDPTGSISDADVRRAAEFGAEVKRRFGKSLMATSGQGEALSMSLGEPTVIDHVMLQEVIARGQRVLEYVVEGQVDGAWRQICSGTSIGYKKIDRFDPVRVSQVRFRAVKAAATPMMLNFAVFNVSGATVAAGVETEAALPASEGPVGHWKLDAVVETLAADSSASGQPGRVMGATAVNQYGQRALSFDGRDDYVSLGNAGFFLGDFSISAWINPRSMARDDRQIVAKERNSVSAHQFRLYLARGNRLAFNLTDGSGEGFWPFEGDEVVPMDSWSHVAVTRQGRKCVLYLNGEKVGSKSLDKDIRHSNDVELRIGASMAQQGDAPQCVFDGMIGDVRIHNRALSIDEIEVVATREGSQRLLQLAKPTREQAAWQDAEIGMFICFGLWSWPIGVTEDLDVLAETQKQFNPTNLDTDQWVRVAESMGAKYVLYTAKHGDGFCMWQTDTTDFSIKNTPWRNGKGDILADLAESCCKRGMKLAIYHDARDMYFGAGLGGKCATDEKQAQYNRIFRQKLTELLSNYGDIFEVWFDGSLVVPVEDILEEYAPNAMVFQSPQTTIRWVGHEEGFAPYPAWNSVNSGNASVQSGNATARHGNPDGDQWLPLECDARIRATWMYEADNADTLKSLDYLMDMYYRSVGHGAVLLLNNTPDTTGLIPETDVKRSAEFGAEIKRRFGKSIASTSGKGEVVELSLDRPTTIDHVISMEDITRGERVRQYAVEGLIGGNWRQLVEGSSVGHKKIDRFDPVAVESVRIRVAKSAAKPQIRKLAVYNVSGEDLTVTLAKPTPSQARWQDDEFGMFIHFGLWTWTVDITSDMGVLGEVQRNFNPVDLDTDQWVAVAESMGAKYVVYTAKHHDGFCMWQTDTTEFSIKNTPWRGGKGDIMADLAASCKKRGMKLGVYLNGQNAYTGTGLGGKCATPEAQEAYNKMYRQQLAELLTRYGDIVEVWFDGSLVVPVADILEKYAAEAMVFQSPQATIRWVGNEDGFADYPAWNSVDGNDPDIRAGTSTGKHGDPNGNLWLPLECDARIRANWMYQDDNTLKSLDYLMEMYYGSVGRGAVLLLNNTPDTTGLIPEMDAKRSAEFGAEIKRRFDRSIVETSGEGDVVELAFDKPTTIDHVIAMEDITEGERVRQYVIEGLVGGTWRQIADGISIGHKKIDKFSPVAVESVRMRVIQSAAKPIIRKLAVYNVSGEDATVKLAKPTAQQADWMDMEMGMFIHFGIETWQDKETDDEPKMENMKLFNPSNVDTDQWVDVAESMGAKYIILVAKHHGGFCLWQTDTTPYSIKNSPYKNGQGDIVADLAETCRRRGMHLGMYLSPADFRFGAVMGGGGKTAKLQDQPIYDKVYRQQLIEVLGNYGEMMEVWFDGSLVIEVGDILEKYAPKAMVFQGKYATIRWVGNEGGYASYPAWNAVDTQKDPVWAAVSAYTIGDGDPDGNFWLPNECDTVIRDHYWFWNSYSEDKLKSLDHLMDIYYKSVGYSSVLLMNVAPDRSGRMPGADVKRAAEFGSEIKRRFGKSIAQTQGEGYAIELDLDKPTIIDHAITMEEIRNGERVREYVIEGLVGDKWQKIVEGSAIGHKKIDRFDSVQVSKVRLRVSNASASPIISKLAVFNVSAGPVAAEKAWESAGYRQAGGWSPQTVGAEWTTVEFDMTDFIPEPRQYEVRFEPAAGAGGLEIDSAVLVLEGFEIPGFFRPLDEDNAFNLNITATPSHKPRSIVIRTRLRSRGGAGASGHVLIRPQ